MEHLIFWVDLRKQTFDYLFSFNNCNKIVMDTCVASH